MIFNRTTRTFDFKSFQALMLIVTLVASLFMMLPSEVKAEDDPYKLTLRVGTRDSVIVEGATPKTDYYSGEQIPATARFEATGTLVVLQNPTIRIVVPKISPLDSNDPATNDKYLTDPNFVSSGQAIAERRGEDANSWWIEYDFSSIKGGTSLEYPFPFTFRNLVTPDGTTVTPVVTVLDANKNVLLEESVTFTAKSSSQYTDRKRGFTPWGPKSDSDGEKLANYPDNVTQLWWDRPFQTDAAFDAAAPLLEKVAPNTSISRQQYEICAVYQPPAGATSGIGEYRAQTLSIVDKLPEHGKFIAGHAVNNGWVYDAATHTATYTAPITSDAATLCKNIILDFTDAPISENNAVKCDAARTRCENDAPYIVHVNKAQVTLDAGMPSEMVLPEVKWDHYYKSINRIVRHQVSYARNFEKTTTSAEYTGRPHTYYDGEIWNKKTLVDSTKATNSLQYDITFSNSNNGQTFKQPGIPAFGGIHDFIHEVEDRELDPRLFFKSLRIDVTAGNAFAPERTQSMARQIFLDAGAKLVGVKADGTEEIILDSVTPSQTPHVLDDADRTYAGWKLKFDRPLELDNFSLNITVWTYPTAAEMQNWADDKYTSAQKYYNGAQATFQTGRTPYTQETNEAGETVWVPGTLQMNPEILKTKYDYNEDNNWIQITPVDPRIRQVSSNNQTVTYTNCERDLGAGVDLTTQNCSRLYQFNFTTTSDGYTAGTWAGVREPLENFRQIVLLPPGVEYKYTNGKAPTPKVVPNFRNTGKTAVIYEWGDVTIDSVKTVLPVLDTTLYANDGLNVVEFYSVWDNNHGSEIEAYWDTSRWTDSFDIDGDGNTTERFLKTTNTITFIPPAEVRLKKMVSLDGNAWVLEAPAQDLGGDIYYKISIGNGDRVPLKRVFVVDVLPHAADHTIVDGVLEDGSVGYAPRWWTKYDPETGETTRVQHSGYSTPIVKAIEDVAQNETLTKFNFFYSVTPQGADLASVRDAQWLTKDQFIAAYGDTKESWAKVTSFRIDLKEGQQIESKEVAEIVIQSEIPFNNETKTLDNGTKSVNSAALSTTNVGYLEANTVRTEIVKYSVAGILWFDLDRDGKFDGTAPDTLRIPNGTVGASDTERVLAGYTVELIDQATGEVAVDPAGVKIATKTDANGVYRLPVYTRGQYQVRFTLNDGDVFTETVFAPNADLDVVRIENHTTPDAAKDTIGFSQAFSLNPEKMHEIRNAGIIPVLVPFELKKLDEFCKPVENVKFKLEYVSPLDRETQVAGLPTVFEATTDANGVLKFKFVNTDNETVAQIPVGNYRLTEVSAPDYLRVLENPISVVVNRDGITHDGAALSAAMLGNCPEPVADPANPDATITIEEAIQGNSDLVLENKWKRGSVEIIKSDSDIADIKLAGAKFQLFNKDGSAVKNAAGDDIYVSPETNASGKTVISDVLYGDYILKEIQAPANYKLDGDTQTAVSIKQDLEIVKVSRSNEVFKGTLKATKIGKPSRDLLPGVEFTLIPKNAPGAEVVTAETDANGVVTFNDVRFGTYILKETKPLMNYLGSEELDGREIAITADGEVVTLSDPFMNELKSGSLSLTKVDADHTGEALVGVKFQLFAKDRETARQAFLGARAEGDTNDPTLEPNWSWEDLPLYTAISDPAGEVSFTGVKWGNYELREVETLPSHKLLPENFDVVIDDQDKHIDLGKIKNFIKRGDIEISKENAWGDRLSGAKFELRQGETVVAEAETNTDGVARFENIAYGDYVVVEVSAPTGYLLAERELPVEVREDAQTVDLTEDPFVNPIVTGTVELNKISGDTQNPLAGVKFGLFPVDRDTARNAWKETARITVGAAEEAADAAEEAADAAEAVVDPTADENWDWESQPAYIAESGETGRISFSGVVFGKYELREISTLENYVLSNERISVEISENGQTLDLGQLENYLKRSDITFKKVNPQLQPLAGATFELRQGAEVVATAESTASGEVTFADIAYGDYQIVETKAPNGYILDAAPQVVEVREDGKEIELADFVNEAQPEPPAPSLAHTGATGLVILPIFVALIIVGSAMMILRRRVR